MVVNIFCFEMVYASVKLFGDSPFLNSGVAKLYIVLIYHLAFFTANIFYLQMYILELVCHGAAQAFSPGRRVG